jgi:hypothetical protein
MKREKFHIFISKSIKSRQMVQYFLFSSAFDDGDGKAECKFAPWCARFYTALLACFCVRA